MKKLATISLLGVVIVSLFLSSTVQEANAKGGGSGGDYIRYLCLTQHLNMQVCKTNGIMSPEKPLKTNNNNNNNQNNNNNNNNQNNNNNNSGCTLSKYFKTCTTQLQIYYPGGKGHSATIVKTSLTLKQTTSDKTPTFIFFTNFLIKGHTYVSCSNAGNNPICFVSYR